MYSKDPRQVVLRETDTPVAPAARYTSFRQSVGWCRGNCFLLDPLLSLMVTKGSMLTLNEGAWCAADSRWM